VLAPCLLGGRWRPRGVGRLRRRGLRRRLRSRSRSRSRSRQSELDRAMAPVLAATPRSTAPKARGSGSALGQSSSAAGRATTSVPRDRGVTGAGPWPEPAGQRRRRCQSLGPSSWSFAASTQAHAPDRGRLSPRHS
jgi:hypothetical protein